MEKTKKRFGDRKDGVLLRDIDSMHFIVPLIYPNRCDNEAYISELVECEAIEEYLARKNAADPELKYTMFHVILTAMLKTITLRPKMNRFIANKNIYQRKEVTASFVVKKEFDDDGAEALAKVCSEPTDTIDTVHDKIYSQIKSCRSDAADTSTESMDILNKMPRFESKFLVLCIRQLDRHGWCPEFLIGSDPYYSSVILSNLGSIKLKCGYHHLTNWGTNSVFCIIGEKKLTQVVREDKTTEVVEALELGLTIDERLADGYYYSKTVRLLRHLLKHPELLDLPLGEKIEY